MNYKEQLRKLVFYNLVLIMAFSAISCSRSYYPESISLNNYFVDEALTSPVQSVVSMISPYKKNIERDMNRVIGFSSAEMIKDKPESLLTNFLADLLLAEGNKFFWDAGKDFKADVSFFNYGGIRTFLPEGEITVGKIYELMPFENEMVFLKIKGVDMKDFLDKIAESGGGSLGGVKFRIKNGKAENIVVNGQIFDISSEYWLITNDYIAEGGDSMEMLENNLEFISSSKLIRDAIIDYIEGLTERGEEINPELDGRIYYDE